MIATASVAAVATGFLGQFNSSPFAATLAMFWSVRAEATNSNVAYAIYFDHRRRTEPEFRRQLRRNERRRARVDKEEAQRDADRQRKSIHTAVDLALHEGFPTSVEEKEAFFMEQVQIGDSMTVDRKLT